MNCSTAAEQTLSEEHWSPHRQDAPAPAHSACMQREKKQAIHTLGTGMTSTWSHYNTKHAHTHIHTHKKNRVRGRKVNRNKTLKWVDNDQENNQKSRAAAHLGRWSVLLNRWRQGAGVSVGGWRFHIVVAEAAEECAEDAPAPLLLEAAVWLGCCQNKRKEVGECRVNKWICKSVFWHKNGTGWGAGAIYIWVFACRSVDACGITGYKLLYFVYSSVATAGWATVNHNNGGNLDTVWLNGITCWFCWPGQAEPQMRK